MIKMLDKIIFGVFMFVLGWIAKLLYSLFRGEDVRQDEGYNELERARRAGL